MNITIRQQDQTEEYFEQLYSLLERERGRSSVYLTMPAGETEVRLEAAGLAVAGRRTLQRELEERGCSVEWIN